MLCLLSIFAHQTSLLEHSTNQYVRDDGVWHRLAWRGEPTESTELAGLGVRVDVTSAATPVVARHGLSRPCCTSAACCVSIWRLKSTLRWKARPQLSQLNGLKPVCLREWVIRLDDWLKAFPHCRHLWGFSPIKR